MQKNLDCSHLYIQKGQAEPSLDLESALMCQPYHEADWESCFRVQISGSGKYQ